jgi:hypothetical protein
MKIEADINAEFYARKSNRAISVFKHILLPVFLSLILFWLFVKCFCFFKDTSSCPALIRSFNWTDGLLFTISYLIVRTASFLFSSDSIFKKMLTTFSFYCLSLSLMAFIIWLMNLHSISSFFANIQR